MTEVTPGGLDRKGPRVRYYYAAGVGLVKWTTSEGDFVLKSFTPGKPDQ